jgi:hypothetical protein
VEVAASVGFDSRDASNDGSTRDDAKRILNAKRRSYRLKQAALGAEVADDAAAKASARQHLNDRILIDTVSNDVILRIVRVTIVPVDSTGPPDCSKKPSEKISLKYSPGDVREFPEPV